MDILCFANILSFLHCYKNKTKTGAKSDGWCEGVNRCSVHVSIREEWVVLTDDISINNITHAHIENKAARSVQDGVEHGCWMTGEGKHHKCHSDLRKKLTQDCEKHRVDRLRMQSIQTELLWTRGWGHVTTLWLSQLCQDTCKNKVLSYKLQTAQSFPQWMRIYCCFITCKCYLD